jgi:ABC-type transporter Mla MlaB component
MKQSAEGSMTMVHPDLNGITLSGDMSMVGVKEQFSALELHLAKRADVQSSGFDPCQPYEIDLTGIQVLDACGCQLLALFLRGLRKTGIAEISLKLSEEYRNKIRSLGFEHELCAGDIYETA